MFWRRLVYLLPWRRRAAERDMQEELRSLAEMAGPGELGNLTLAAEDARAEWGWTRLEQTGQDLRYAVRTLRKSPIFTITAVLSLAIGIGANTALFTLTNAIMWKLLPIQDPEQLVALRLQYPGGVVQGLTYDQFKRVRDGNEAVDFAAFARTTLNVGVDGDLEPPIDGQLVTGGYFPVLGVRPSRGRLFGPDDDRAPAAHPVAVISDAYWRGRFSRDPDILGKTLTLSGVPFTIIGVTPPEFFGVEVGAAPKVFVPVMMQPVVMPATQSLVIEKPNLFSTWLRVVGRMKPGTTLAQIEGQLEVRAQEPGFAPRNKFSGEVEQLRIDLKPAATGLSDLRAQLSQPLFILMGVVAIVLLVACTNTGNLVLARSASRRSEFALRLALGAGRSRLIRQVLAEGAVLAVLGGAVGAVLAFWATRGLVTYASAGRNPIVLDLTPDLRVLAFTVAVSTIAGLLFASWPAIRASRSDPALASRGDLSTARQIRGGRAPSKTLLIAQVALSLVLLVAAGLFARTLQNLNHHEADVDQSSVLLVRVEPRGSNRNGSGATERIDRIYRDLLANLQRVPGVQSASLARTSPMTPFSHGTLIRMPSGGDERIPAMMIYPRYFATMGIPIVKGRDFNENDLKPNTPRVVLVNETFVRQILNGREPLGTHDVIAQMTRQGGPTFTAPVTIIGVVRDTRYPAMRDAPTPVIYQTFLQTNTGFGQMVLHVKVTSEMSEVARQVREAVQALDREVPPFEVHTLDDEVKAALVRERLLATLSAGFGLVALLLMAIGLYGLMAFTVSGRTAEIGVRVALGATRASVGWMIVSQTLIVVFAGVAVGLPIAWIAGRAAAGQLSAVLFELTPTDPATLTAAVALLATVAAIAGALPARRATRIDPIIALRHE